MAKTPSPALFDLIHNMSKSEKRYFKIHASKHTIGDQNKYIQLFDFIDQQKEFNEDEIIHQFQGESFLNKFSIAKNRLYDYIIRALDSYHSKSSIDASIYKRLHGAEILYNKGLYNHAIKQLKTAKNTAEKHGKTALLIKIQNQLNEIIETQGYNSLSTEELIIKEQQFDELINEQHYLTKLWFLKSRLFKVINFQGKSRSKDEVSEFTKLFEAYRKLEQPKHFSFQMKYLALHFESAYFFAILDYEKCLNALHQNLALFQSKPIQIKNEPHKYLSLLTNSIHLELTAGDNRKIYALLGELNTFERKYNLETNEDLAIKLFSSIKSTNLMVYIHQAEFEKAIAMEEIIINGLQEYASGLAPFRKAYLSFNLAIAFFGNDQFNESLKWINSILNDTDLDENEDILAFAHIVGIIIHYELNHIDYLPYALKSTLRFLQKIKRDYPFEKLFLVNVRKLVKTDDPFKKQQVFQNIAVELQEFEIDPFKSVSLEYFDFKSWLISKIKHKRFNVVKRTAYLAKTA
jgi:hypothetical protein